MGVPILMTIFSKESIVKINLNDFNGSINKIRDVIRNPQFYKDRYDAIKEAKRMVMKKYNLLALLDTMIPGLDTSSRNACGKILHGRKKCD